MKQLLKEILERSRRAAVEAEAPFSQPAKKPDHELDGRIFDFLTRQEDRTEDSFLLCSADGRGIRLRLEGETAALGERKLDTEMLEALKQKACCCETADGCLIFGARSAVQALGRDMSTLTEIYVQEMADKNFILRALDFMDNPLCVYDRNGVFRYGNASYCSVMNIADRQAAVGTHVNELLSGSGTSIHAIKTSSSKFKMFDVLENGRKVLDWEVRVESQSKADETSSVFNSMYPVFSENDEIEGVLEILYFNKLNLNKVNRLVGHTAEYTFDSIIGESSSLRGCVEIAREFAAAGRYSVLIAGESGVGKELFAQAIHNDSSRSQEAFIALNCANFPENLFESELFGYVGGAFTGASKNGQIGKFELADGGTLFLDEIGEMPLAFQSKLLRVLETGKITRIGGTKEIKVDVRVITATNRDLEKMVEEGLFRKDLYYRLQVLNLIVPPLRERQDDVLLLTEFFLRQAASANGTPVKKLDAGARQQLKDYDWPGNVRELRNVIQRVALLSRRNVISGGDIAAAISSKSSYALAADACETQTEDRLEKSRDDVRKAQARLLHEALEMAGGSKQEAAALLGVSRATFYRMLEKYRQTR